ncbi:MAG: hypothetical protein HYX41_02855 [Bdellovibrio sp.]|nr:hypothetical protein [Bdellovibrio sp.]
MARRRRYPATLSFFGWCILMTLWVSPSLSWAGDHDIEVLLNFNGDGNDRYFKGYQKRKEAEAKKKGTEYKSKIITIYRPEDLKKGSSAFKELADLHLTTSSKVVIVGHGHAGDTAIYSVPEAAYAKKYPSRDVAHFISEASQFPPDALEAHPKSVKVTLAVCSSALDTPKVLETDVPTPESKHLAHELLRDLEIEGVPARIAGFTGIVVTNNSAGRILALKASGDSDDAIRLRKDEKRADQTIERLNNELTRARNKSAPTDHLVTEIQKAEQEKEKIQTDLYRAEDLDFQPGKTGKVVLSTDKDGKLVTRYKNTDGAVLNEKESLVKKLETQKLQIQGHYDNELRKLEAQYAPKNRLDTVRAERDSKLAKFQGEIDKIILEYDSKLPSQMKPEDGIARRQRLQKLKHLRNLERENAGLKIHLEDKTSKVKRLKDDLERVKRNLNNDRTYLQIWDAYLAENKEPKYVKMAPDKIREYTQSVEYGIQQEARLLASLKEAEAELEEASANYKQHSQAVKEAGDCLQSSDILTPQEEALKDSLDGVSDALKK